MYYNLFQNTHLASYIDKVERIKFLQNSKKAIFIGGSATHFGIQAELFEKETGVPSVNMGLHAGGSFKMYMNNIFPYLTNDDIVFICPEYEYYSSTFDRISDVSIDLIYMTDQTIYKNTNFFYKIKTIPETFIAGWRHLGNIVKYHVASLTKKNYIDLFLGDYRRDYSDKYGDYKGIKDIPNRSFYINHSFTYDDNMFISELDKYLGCIVKNNIEIYLLFPPADYSLFENSNSEIERIYYKILSSKNVKPLFHPKEVLYNNNDFFNHYYHLNYNAAIEHTKFIILKYKDQE
jgi:hypothetical protein